MDSEQIIFIIIALAFSILGMFLKSKKRKQASNQNEESYYDYPQPEELNPQDQMVISEPREIHYPQHNFNIYPKMNKKKQKKQNIETIKPSIETSKNTLQNTDIENEIELLMDFEGTEIQKAFLYSEIFKSTKN